MIALEPFNAVVPWAGAVFCAGIAGILFQRVRSGTYPRGERRSQEAGATAVLLGGFAAFFLVLGFVRLITG